MSVKILGASLLGSALIAVTMMPAPEADARHSHGRPREKCSYGWMKQCTPIARRMDCRWIRYKGCTSILS